MRKAMTLICSLTAFVQAAAFSDTCRQETWSTNGYVAAICKVGNTVYIGGEFTYVGPNNNGCGMPLSISDGTVATSFPKVDGTVSVACPDGKGGWFIGGNFSKVNDVARGSIAHLLAGGGIDSAWNLDAGGGIKCLTVSGTTLYVGGEFSSIGRQKRNGLAALDATTGVVRSWDPQSKTFPGDYQTITYSIAVSGTTVYVGGHFDSIGGQERRGIAALDSETGAVTAWNPRTHGNIVFNHPVIRSLALRQWQHFIRVGGIRTRFPAPVWS